MTQRLKITLTDAVMDELRSVAARDGVPVARIAARRVSQPCSDNEPDRNATLLPALIADDDFITDNRAPWIEPIMGDEAWRRRMWASIVALYGRYPRALAHLRDGWWNQSAHFETLCALVIWRDWIDVAADDPRHELAFQAQLTDYSLQLRQEGGSVTDAWKPGAPPIEWFAAPSA